VRLDVADRLIDLTHGEADIGIRCGPGNWSYYVVCSVQSLQRPEVKAFHDWLLGECV